MTNEGTALFHWHEFDINGQLHEGWDREIIQFALNNAVYKEVNPSSVTSRESPDISSIHTLTVDGEKIREGLPWLFNLYENVFFSYGKSCVDESLYLATHDLYAINLNVQHGNKMRYECHVDSNPLQGVFYVTSHSRGDGGELIVSNNPRAIGVAEIEEDCEVIYPKSGILLLFSASKNPHYVRPLTKETDIRISVTMNFYTDSNPESERPSDLNDHLF